MRSLYTLLLSGLLSITAWHNICAGEKILIGVDTLTNSSAAGDDILTTLKSRLENSFARNEQFAVIADRAKLVEQSKDAAPEATVIGIRGNVLSVNLTSSYFIRNKRRYIRTFCTIEMSVQLCDMKSGLIRESKQVKATSTPIIEASTRSSTTVSLRRASEINARNLSSTEAAAYYDALQKAVDETFELLINKLYPLYVAAVSNNQIYIDLPVPELLKTNSGDTVFEILQLGEEIIDPDTGRVIGRTENRVMLAQLNHIDNNFPIAVPIDGHDNLPLLREELDIYHEKAAQSISDSAEIHPPFLARPLPGQNTAEAMKNRFRRH